MKIGLVSVTWICVASAVLAHGGVTNRAVLERMEGMTQLADSVKVLGNMAKGATGFDPDRAAEAKAALAHNAAQVTAQFRAPETDPKSEALPVIWSDWDRFAQEAAALEKAVADMETGTLEGVRAGLGTVGQSCSGCHERYRLEKK